MGFSIVPSPEVLVQAVPLGSSCCVWRDGLREYMLSAAHVVGDLPEGSAIQWISLAGQVGLGTTVDPSLYWITTQGGAMDAGLVAISSPGPFSFPSSYPWGGQVMEWHELDFIKGRPVIICGKSGQTFGTFEGKRPAGQIIGGRIRGRLLRCRYDHAPSVGGDSGAVVLSLPEGKVIGVHIAKDADERFSLAVPACDVLEAFEQRLPGFHLRP